MYSVTSQRKYLLGATLLQAAVVAVISTSGSPCRPEVVCNPPSVQLANLSFPLRRLNVSSTCGADNSSTRFCLPGDTCSADSWLTCSGQHTAELMLDGASSATSVHPDLSTYWLSDNSISVTGAQPTTQYIEVRIAHSEQAAKLSLG